MRETEKVPNFVTVDFYATGDLLDTCRTLNSMGP